MTNETTDETESGEVRGGLDRGEGGEFLPSVSDDAVLATLVQAYPEPLSASEIGDRINVSRTTAHNRLQKYANDGPVGTKKIGARARVYWLRAAPAEA